MKSRRSNRWLALLLSLFLGHSIASHSMESFELERIAAGLSEPLLVTHAGDGSGRLFIVEQTGRIRVLLGARLLAEPFLDLSSEIASGGERGLLGLAFSPRFEETGFFFVNYTDRRGDTVVSRFSVSEDTNRADASSEVEVLSFRQPASNHNGGHLAFGPDGYLYVASGDGGGTGDPQGNGQSQDTFLGKILRLDVGGLPYSIPPDNPFASGGSAKPEIWALGLRNPWRFSFDRKTGDLFIGDVGQDREEEINLQAADSRGGENYGWNRKEGSLCFDPSTNCGNSGLTDPILVYSHGPHCSVTAGYRYRGKSNPSLSGVFVFGDFCSGLVWGAQAGSGGAWSASILADTNLSISSFGEDEAGELYIVDRGGSVYRIAGSSLLSDDFEIGDTSGWKKARGNVEVVQPGLKGSGHALQVTLDGTGRKSALMSTVPRREKTLSVRFLLDANQVDLSGQQIDLFQLVGNGGTILSRLTLQPKGSRYKVRLWVALENGEEVLVGESSVRKKGATRIGMDWARSTSAQLDDGAARLIKGRRSRAESDGLATALSPVKAIELGLPGGSQGTEEGTLLFDDFVLTR